MSSPPPPISPLAMLSYARPNARQRTLREIALRQKWVMYCALAYIVIVLLATALPREVSKLLMLAAIAASVMGAISIFRLALVMYSTGTGIVLGIVTLIPLVGLITLLIVNGKATATLGDNGIKVGLMGAKIDQVPPA